ncbi:interferon-induced GTP-binding protein Mx2-like [Onychostoma macrolepis]|uniref:interferon-induced GTP-binding protein Mx2-like n=1 Tax=Onychostoma macrolepis TaxID=369639 RepID=UPI00272968E9|nr:interferon-induced GTP-binding protein Mx2-like [Onychostoma macrolepis]
MRDPTGDSSTEGSSTWAEEQAPPFGVSSVVIVAPEAKRLTSCTQEVEPTIHVHLSQYSHSYNCCLKRAVLTNLTSADISSVPGEKVILEPFLMTLWDECPISDLSVCDLTLIDLPGIARVPVNGQPQDIGSQIKRMIMKYTEKQETINMVMCPCNTDIATTEALKMAQEVDPDGKRTVAILTKPDLIDKGTEKRILRIVSNEVIPLRKGYIMVKCRGQQQIDDNISLEESAHMERDFFQNHEHFSCLLQEEKATIKSLAVKLSQHLVDHIKKSLPQLNEQIKKKLWDLRNELKECEAGPPQDPRGAKKFLIQFLSNFSDSLKKIQSLSLGELIIKENLFGQLREQFRKWNDHLNSSKTSCNDKTAERIQFSHKYRGRELLGFSNYKMFEDVLQDHVATLKAPAIKLLNTIKDIILEQFTDVVKQCFQNYSVLQNIIMNKIKNIQSSQQAKAEQRISEQFEMEKMIYTQDPIYLKFLNEISDEKFSEDELPVFDIKSKYSEMLEAYYEIVVQRMSDQLPMMISFFMLKETAQLLSIDMLSLLDGANVSELMLVEIAETYSLAWTV